MTVSNEMVAPAGTDGPIHDEVDAPAHYTKGRDREVIDKIRDSMSDIQFAAHCHGCYLKYTMREGLKGPARIDRGKAEWYRQMREHVLGRAEDPRSERPDFKPYARQAVGMLYAFPHHAPASE